jgi:hypothetical protein
MFAFAVVMTAVLMVHGVWSSCTLKGPHGHQLWAMLMVPDPTLAAQEWLLPGMVEALPSFVKSGLVNPREPHCLLECGGVCALVGFSDVPLSEVSK